MPFFPETTSMSTAERLTHRAWAIEEWARVLKASPDWASLKYPIGFREGWMESRSDRGGPVYTTPGIGQNYGLPSWHRDPGWLLVIKNLDKRNVEKNSIKKKCCRL